MKINENFQYDGIDVHDVYDLISSEDFRRKACEAQRSLDLNVTVEPNGDGHTVTIHRKLPAEVPDFIKRLTGETVEVEQTEQWSGPSADGTRTADVSVKIIGQPAGLKGTSRVSASDDGAVLNVAGDVEVKIPLIGRKIEPEIAKTIIKSMRQEVQLGIETLTND